MIKGSTTADDPGAEEKTCATITLIKDNGVNMVVDPGVLESQKILADALAREGLAVDDIDIVFVTHSHLDHYRNVGMFKKARNLEFYGIWEGGKCLGWKEEFTPDIRIIKTPGHSADSITFLVKTAEDTVAICGDVFWKENFPKMISMPMIQKNSTKAAK